MNGNNTWIRGKRTMGKFMDMFEKVQQGETALKQMAKLKNNETVGEITKDDSYLEYAKADVEATQAFVEGLEELNRKGIYIDGQPVGDTRYNVPKAPPETDSELVEETIMNTEIYRRARLAVVQAHFLSGESRTSILEAQRKQVAYGLDKYPEPLNPNTWTIGETVEHIMDESIDRLHYLIMLRIKLEQSLVSGAFNDILEVRNTNSRIASISRMIDNTIEELHYLVTLVIATDRETEAQPEEFSATKVMRDAMDSMAYTLNNGEGLMWGKNGIDMTNSDTLRVFTDDELETLSKGDKLLRNKGR